MSRVGQQCHLFSLKLSFPNCSLRDTSHSLEGMSFMSSLRTCSRIARLVSKYKMRFTKLSRHAMLFIPTKAERVSRFIEGLNYGIKLAMVKEAEKGPYFIKLLRLYIGLSASVFRKERQ